MNRFPFHPVTALVCMALAAPRAASLQNDEAAAPTVVVLDRIAGCEEYTVKKTEFVLNGDDYVGPTHRFPKGYIDGLRSLILSSHEDTSTLLAQLGFTPEAVAERRGDIYTAARYWCEELPESIPAWAAALFEYAKIRAIAFDALAGEPMGSTTEVEFRVTLPGDPPLTIYSKAERPWMLPWSVEAGGTTWETYSLLVSKALAVLADPTGPNAAWLDGTRYWSRDVWRDVELWGLSIGRSMNATFSRSMCESLDGFEHARKLFSIESAMIGNINSAPRSLYAQLRACKPMLVDAACWWNPLAGKRPTTDWSDFLTIHEACTTAAAPHVWLNDWKRCAPARQISLEVVGTDGFSESNMQYEILPTWSALGMAGRPQFELLLLNGGRPAATIFLGSREPRALVLNARLGEGEHWLDQLIVEAPFCLIVDRQGRFEKHRLVTQRQP